MSGHIEKSEALENLKNLPVTLDSETVQRCIETISNMPTVEAEPVKYTYLKKSRNYPGVYECSECGVTYPQSVKNSGIILNYCSKCGAKFLRGEGV